MERWNKVFRRLGLIFAAVGSVAVFSLGIPPLLLAQAPPKYQYQLWRNPSRFEGIRTGHHVLGERLELVSVIARGGFRCSQIPQRLFVVFASDSIQNVSITVRDLENNYWMEPVDESGKKTFKAKPGFNYFPWDADDVNYIHRTAQDLYALIERGGQGTEFVSPAILLDSSIRLPGDLQVTEYEFAFLPNAEADFSYIVQTDDGRKLQSVELIDLPKDQAVPIKWKPVGQKDGVYELKGKATFHLKNGALSRPQDVDLKFYHASVIHISEMP
jgi:hypothetical protein